MGLFKKQKKADGGSASMEQTAASTQQIADRMRGGHVSVRDMASLVRSAHEMQQQAVAMQQQVQEAQSSGGGVGAIMAALGMHYDSGYAKRVDCPVCGAPKKLPSPTAYLYCDYCGALSDYDFRLACKTSALPGPAYRNIVMQTKAEADGAKAAGDHEGYLATQRRIYDAYITACPGAVSHRIGDPTYRAAAVECMAQNTTLCDFDPTYAELMAEVTSTAAGIQWQGGLMARRAESSSFRRMVDACDRHAARANQLVDAAGLIDLDPDHAHREVRERMRASLLCQGWLPMLEEDDARWFIDHLHLSGEYEKLDIPAEGEERSCGACGHAVTVLPGAKVRVCDGCGRQVDVGGGAARCGGCGGALVFPVGVTRLQCPHCQSEAERVGWT